MRRFVGAIAALWLTGILASAAQAAGVVNLYSSRHYDTDAELYKLFTQETGIQVNVLRASDDELIERLAREGKDTPADLLITADAGRLHRAKAQGLLQPVQSPVLYTNIPENLRDRDSQWFGLTMRARVIAYAKDRVKPSDIATYEDLADPKWKGKVLARSSSNVYNQSLLASFIALHGEQKAREWARGVVANMARPPKGSDTTQMVEIAQGIGDLAVVNTYYYGRLLNSSNPEEVKVAKGIGILFPNQATTGTHVNVSGAGVTKYAKNRENAIKLLEFLSSEKAQRLFADANYEYPVNPKVEPSPLLQSWGAFKRQNINLTVLGENNAKAVAIFDAVGWQ